MRGENPAVLEMDTTRTKAGQCHNEGTDYFSDLKNAVAYCLGEMDASKGRAYMPDDRATKNDKEGHTE